MGTRLMGFGNQVREQLGRSWIRQNSAAHAIYPGVGRGPLNSGESSYGPAAAHAIYPGVGRGPLNSGESSYGPAAPELDCQNP